MAALKTPGNSRGAHWPACTDWAEHLRFAVHASGEWNLSVFVEQAIRDWETEQIATDIEEDPHVAVLFDFAARIEG